MPLDERYMLATSLNQYFVDKTTGLPLANGTLTFYRNSAPATPKNVYQLSGIEGSYTYTALPNPMTLSSVGTVQNAGGDNELIYYFPYKSEDDNTLDLYYIVAKDSGGIEQFTRQAFPNIGPGGDPTQNDFHITNELSNCQFSRVLINANAATSYAVAAETKTFEFAPDWDFVITGTGTVIVERVAVAGDDDILTNPSYTLKVTVPSGVTTCNLRQRLLKNSGLFASVGTPEKLVAGFFVAKNEGVGTITIGMYYNESAGLIAPIQIVDASVTTTYGEKTGSVVIPDSANTQTSDTAYVDIYLSFPESSVSSVTSIQLVPTATLLQADIVPFDEVSSNRDQSRMGDYYIPRLEEKQIPSLLTGWDFPLNPAQINSTKTLTATGAYTWDQTIARRVDANVSMARNAITGGAQFTNTGATEAYSVMQYLSGEQAQKMIGTRLSVNVSAFKGSAGASATCRVYLYRAPAATAFPTIASAEFGSLTTDGILSSPPSGWVIIPRSGLDTASADLTTVTTNDDLNNDIDFGFTGWEITTASEIGDTFKFAIVVTFETPTVSTIVTVNSISVVPGDIPTRPAPQTKDEVLRECKYYFEMSYPNGSVPGTTISAVNQREIPIAVLIDLNFPTHDTIYLSSFSVEYSTKRTAPTVTFYSPTIATADRALVTGLTNTGVPFTRASGAIATNPGNITVTTNYTQTTKGTDRLIMRCITTQTIQLVSNAAADGDEGIINYQFVADARLGII